MRIYYQRVVSATNSGSGVARHIPDIAASRGEIHPLIVGALRHAAGGKLVGDDCAAKIIN